MKFKNLKSQNTDIFFYFTKNLFPQTKLKKNID